MDLTWGGWDKMVQRAGAMTEKAFLLDSASWNNRTDGAHSMPLCRHEWNGPIPVGCISNSFSAYFPVIMAAKQHLKCPDGSICVAMRSITLNPVNKSQLKIQQEVSRIKEEETESIKSYLFA